VNDVSNFFDLEIEPLGNIVMKVRLIPGFKLVTGDALLARAVCGPVAAKQSFADGARQGRLPYPIRTRKQERMRKEPSFQGLPEVGNNSFVA